MITLTAKCGYNVRFAPNGVKKPYIARILGRDPKMTFRREFVGKTEALVDDPGLYEMRDVDKKGRPDNYYCVILEVDGELCRSTYFGRENAMKIAKAFDQGRPIEEIVYLNQRPSSRDPSVMVWDVQLITPRQAEQRATAKTIDEAVAACWQILSPLSRKEAEKVVAQLRKLASPPKVPQTPLRDDTPVGIVADAASDAGVPDIQLGRTPTPVATFTAGDKVVCEDATDAANFLIAGQTYEVSSVQTDDEEQLRLCLHGMARAWEAGRFRRV